MRAFHTGDKDDEFRLTLDNTQGALHDVLLEARLASRVKLRSRSTYDSHPGIALPHPS